MFPQSNFQRNARFVFAGAVMATLFGCGGGTSEVEAVALSQVEAVALSQDELPTGVTISRAQMATPKITGNPVYDWNKIALDTARSDSLIDAQAARLYAMLNVAMFDAVNGIESQTGLRRKPAIVPVSGAPKKGDEAAAASAAAHKLLTLLYPSRSAVYDAQLNEDLAGIDDGDSKSEGVAWGVNVANAVYAQRLQDGSAVNESQPAGSGIGVFRASWSGTQFRNLAPFAIADSSAYTTLVRPALTSAEYAAALNDVKTVGNAAIPDAQAMETYKFWVSAAGTGQPPGEWIKVASGLGTEKKLSLPDSARFLALVSMAMADAVAPTFSVKYNNHAWRPTTAIREADLDGNADTVGDATWSPRGGSVGGTPEFISGHSTFSAAATTVMRGAFCTDNVSFTVLTDSAPNGARSYTSFSQAEAEAGRSRVLGGVHFEFSNQGGLEIGRAVGAEVFAKALRPVNGVPHQDACLGSNAAVPSL